MFLRNKKLFSRKITLKTESHEKPVQSRRNRRTGTRINRLLPTGTSTAQHHPDPRRRSRKRMYRLLRRSQLPDPLHRLTRPAGNTLRKHARHAPQHPFARATHDRNLQRPQLCQLRIHERRRAHFRTPRTTGRVFHGDRRKMAARTFPGDGFQARIRRMVPLPARNLQGTRRGQSHRPLCLLLSRQQRTL